MCKEWRKEWCKCVRSGVMCVRSGVRSGVSV